MYAVPDHDILIDSPRGSGGAESGFQGPLSLETGGPAEKLAPEAPLTVVDAAERMNADAARYLAAEIEKAR